jgi:hypothetical protein
LFPYKNYKAISCWFFFSVLRQIKIVKPTRQPGEKQTSFKKQNRLCILYERKTQQKFDLFHLST